MKVEEDFLAALDLARRRKKPVWDAVCFHCQQAAEKYLKARMHEAGLTVRRTHDLETLLNDLLPFEPVWAAFRTALQDLSDFAVHFRYPGNRATKSQARRSILDCRTVRREVRLSLGLSA